MDQVERSAERAIEAAKTQSMFRGVNERVEELNETFAPLVDIADWICECADHTCIEQIEMTLRDYERIRSHPRRFLVVLGHEVPEVERVVERHDGFLVVEKMGAAAAFAEAHDPRAHSTPGSGPDSSQISRARNDALHGRYKAARTQSEELQPE